MMRVRRIALVALLAIAACSGSDAGPSDREQTANTPATTSVETTAAPTTAPEVDRPSIAVRLVVDEGPAPCQAEASAGEPAEWVEAGPECLLLEPPVELGGTVVEVEPIDDSATSHPRAVSIQLDAVGAAAFDELAAVALERGGRMAVALDGRVVGAPFIQQASFGGSLLLTSLTADEAVRLVSAFPTPPRLDLLDVPVVAIDVAAEVAEEARAALAGSWFPVDEAIERAVEVGVERIVVEPVPTGTYPAGPSADEAWVWAELVLADPLDGWSDVNGICEAAGFPAELTEPVLGVVVLVVLADAQPPNDTGPQIQSATSAATVGPRWGGGDCLRS